jgi:hypothetical protein
VTTSKEVVMANLRADAALVAVLAATAMVLGTGQADARPDPGERTSVSAPAADGVGSRPRPTGLAEHGGIHAPLTAAASASTARGEPDLAAPPLAAPAAADGFDWVDAGIGALASIAAVGLAVGTLGARRRGRGVPQAM